MKRLFSKQRWELASDSRLTASADAWLDQELLERFLEHRDDQAFAELVTRYGAMVMAVCRRTLSREEDAEDAFQATFLVLSRKAGSLRRAQSLGAWLYQTAYRIALRARANRARRREEPLEAEIMIAQDMLSHIAADYEQSVVDDELNRLPEKYRLPLFLCCVEGKSLDEAARQLGCSFGSVKGRLERGRQELRQRLILRRVSPLVAVGVLASLQQTAQASQILAPSLVASTVQAGMQYAAGQTALGYVSQNALLLAKGSSTVMSTTKMVACSGLILGALAWGGTQLTPSAVGGGDGINPDAIVLQATGTTNSDIENLVAFAAEDEKPRAEGERRGPRDGEQPKTGLRDGDRPKTGPRDGEGVKKGPRDGEGPAKAGPREGEGDFRKGPREGEGFQKPGAREGEGFRPRGEGQGNPLAGFQPQTPREAALYQMIMQLQQQINQLRAEVQGRSDAPSPKFGGREGDARPKPGLRDGEGGPRTGPRDGDAPAKAGPRDGDAPKKFGPREGDAPAKTGPREEDAPVKKAPREEEEK